MNLRMPWNYWMSYSAPLLIAYILCVTWKHVAARREPPDTSLSIEDREIGGLGIHLCREMMDDTFYQRSDERNIVTLSLNLAS